MLLFPIFLILVFLTNSSTCSKDPTNVAETSNIGYVNPLIGTDNSLKPFNYGGTIPSTSPPFAMTRWTPCMQENKPLLTPYLYNGETKFYGFLGSHQPTIAMGEAGEVSVMAGTGSEIKTTFEGKGLNFSHDFEISMPHYYKTKLYTSIYRDAYTGMDEDAVIEAELSSTSRAAIMRFTFDEAATSSTPYAVIQATRRRVQGGYVKIDPAAQEIHGWNPERQDSNLGPFTADSFKGYFVAQFDQPFLSWGIAHGAVHRSNETEGQGSDLSGFVTFASSSTTSSGNGFNPQSSGSPTTGTTGRSPSQFVVNVRVGVSYISIEQARQNLQSEIPQGATLEDVATETARLWSDKLDLIDIEGATEDERTIFYTGIYHSLQFPSEIVEHNKSGSYYYSGYDDTVHRGEHAYTSYSIWDIYRAQWALLILLVPERIAGMIQSMLQIYQQSGRLPIWPNIVETNTMIGTHSSSLIAEALSKGYGEDDFDTSLAWEAMLKDAEIPPDDDLTCAYAVREEGTGCQARAGLTRQKKLGWVAALLTSEAGSRTLEYAYDDYTIATAAQFIFKEKLSTEHVYKDSSKLAKTTAHTPTGSSTDGAHYYETFMERSKAYKLIFNNETMLMEARFANGSWCNDSSTWTEGSSWIYTFDVPHDFVGLRDDLFGGPATFAAKLDEYYQGGYDDPSNEPAQTTPFAYLYANRPWRTQETVRSLLRDNYFNSPIGMTGNEDCGQMSAWYIFNTMGFYPVNPTSATYLVGTPSFDRISINFPQNNNTLTITAKGASSKQYVAGMTIDGVDVDVPVLMHTDILNSKDLSFLMSDEPQNWAAGAFE